MVAFRNTVRTAPVTNWWDNGANQIAFSRGTSGFIAFNGQFGVDLSQTLQTGLPQGAYCDLVTGRKAGNSCTGTKVTVGADGRAAIFISSSAPEGFLAFTIDSRL
jgi:alpha-amylase